MLMQFFVRCHALMLHLSLLPVRRVNKSEYRVALQQGVFRTVKISQSCRIMSSCRISTGHM